MPSNTPPESIHRVSFHGSSYVLTCTVASAGALIIDVEQEDVVARWHGEFASKYIEDISQKTGNFKRFATFVRMLRSALDGDSTSVFVDLLTAQDLNALKSRRSGKAAAGPGSLGVSTSSSFTSDAAAPGKRYLILTYTAEFDKVHYPLPLTYEEKPSPASLQRTINRLRRELLASRDAKNSEANGAGEDGGSSLASLRGQVSELQSENSRLRASMNSEGSAKDGRNAQALREAVEARMELRRFKEIAQAEMATLKKDCKSLASKLRDARSRQEQAEEKARDAASSASTARGAAKEVRALERRLDSARAAVQREKNAHRRTKSTHQRQIEALKSEVKSLKGQITRYRMQLRDANRSLSRGPRGRSSVTPRGRRTKRSTSSRGQRAGRSTSSGYGSRSQSRSVDRSYGSVSSLKSSGSARSTRTTRLRSARSKKAGSSSAKRSRVLQARRTPSPSVRSGASSAGRFSTYSSGGSYRTSARSSTRPKKKVVGKKTVKVRRSKRHPSPFSNGYSSSESRASSADSRRSRRSSGGIENRRVSGTNIKRVTSTAKKTTKRMQKKKKKTSVRVNNLDDSGIPPPAPSLKPTILSAPPSEENDALSLNISAAAQENAGPMSRSAAPRDSPKKDVSEGFNANNEMADIDRRLNALQVRVI